MATTTRSGSRTEVRIIWWFASLAMVLLVSVGGFLIAYLRASAVADCLNNILGERAGVTASDARAHIVWSKEIQKLTAHPATSVRGQRAASLEFQAATNRYVAVLSANQAYRDSHPLGAC